MAALVTPTSLVRAKRARAKSAVPHKGRGPKDWQAQMRASVRSSAELAAALVLTPEELEGARRAEREGLPIAITPYYLSLCDRHEDRKSVV